MELSALFAVHSLRPGSESGLEPGFQLTCLTGEAGRAGTSVGQMTREFREELLCEDFFQSKFLPFGK